MRKLGVFKNENYTENMSVLYFPVSYGDNAHEHRINSEYRNSLLPFKQVVDRCLKHLDNCFGVWELPKYCYLTVNRGYVYKNNHQNREGWHVDGYGTSDINFIWCDREPTEYINLGFTKAELGLDHEAALRLFDLLGDKVENTLKAEENTIYILDNIVHRTPLIRESGMRTFVKVSFSNHKYNLKGNAISRINKNWKFYERDIVRNCPIGRVEDGN